MKKILLHPFIFFLPFLFIYLLLAFYLYDPNLYGDEKRYVRFAQNLLKGFYSPKDKLDLWNGPGYPLILAPVLALGFYKKAIVLLNVLFYYASLILLYKTLLHYIQKKTALIVSLFWACYYVAYQEMAIVFSEPLTLLLITIILYFLTLGFKIGKQKYNIFCGFALGYLVLTKVIFWYVLIVLFFIYVASFLFQHIKNQNKKQHTLRIVKILLTACVVISPYLFYTYGITGKPFYLANSGGMSLYWMSTPYEGEYGDWNSETFEANCFPQSGLPCNAELFRKNHAADIKYVQRFSGVEKDEAYKKLAFQNIKTYPVKYLKNCVANIGRLWFGFPFSYFYQRDRILLRIPPNAVLLCFLMIATPLHLYNFRKIKTEVSFIALLFFLYLGISMLVSAYQRQFYVIVPMIIFWETYIFCNTIKLRLKMNSNLYEKAPLNNNDQLLHNNSGNKTVRKKFDLIEV